MVGGFLTNGTPENIIDVIVESGAKNLTIICNDGGLPEKGVGKLIQNKQVKTLIASHVGTMPEVAVQFNEGILDLQLVPQGTLVERIRSAGAGLGGILTPTGLGTIVADNKQVIEVDGQEFLLEKALKADVAIIKGHIVDESGNVRYRGSTRNFNPIMATAAEIVIVEADRIVPSGEIGPEYVETPGVYIDYIVGGNE
jgi:acetate CoA/acetoacetate CoA-transferase alpha subunit